MTLREEPPTDPNDNSPEFSELRLQEWQEREMEQIDIRTQQISIRDSKQKIK
jgi:hypothetical protein